MALRADIDARHFDARSEIAFEPFADENGIIRVRALERAQRFAIVMMRDEAPHGRGASTEYENEHEGETVHWWSQRWASQVREMPNVSSWSVTSPARVT